MTIIITVGTYYPYKDGVAAVTKYHAEGLARKGHKVTILTAEYAGAEEKETVHGVDIVRDKLKTVHAVHRGDKKAYQQKIIALSKTADVIVNVCTQTVRTDWMLPVMDKIQCPTVLYLHGMLDFTWNRANIKNVKSVASKLWNNIRWKYLYVSQANNLKKYDVVSQLHEFDSATLYFFKKYGIRSVIIENAADDVFFENYGTKKSGMPYIVCVANYMERKNQMLCLEAFYRADVSKEWQLLFVGSEENAYYSSLVERKKELDAEYRAERSVHFRTNVPREDVAGIVAGAELYIMGSTWEAFPISIVEAMAAGVPFISTNVGCVRYLPGGVIAEDEADMSYWMKKLADNEKVRKALGLAGHEYAVNHFRTQNKIDALEQQLIKLCNGSRNRE